MAVKLSPWEVEMGALGRWKREAVGQRPQWAAAAQNVQIGIRHVIPFVEVIGNL